MNKGQDLAIALRAPALVGLRPEPARAVSAIRRPSPIAEHSSLVRFQADERQIREKYAALRLKLAADERRELGEADRKFWAGEYTR